MALIKLGRNTQVLLLIAAAAAAGHFYVQKLYKPLQSELHFLTQEKMRIESEIPLLGAASDELKEVEEKYKRKFEEFSKFEAGVSALEEKIPSRKDMARLLEQLTSDLNTRASEFVSLEPKFKKAEREEPFDSIEMDMKFYADYPQVIDYLAKLESKPLLLSMRKIEMILNAEDSLKPLTTVTFSTLVSNRIRGTKTEEKIEPIVAPRLSESPFRSEVKPYDNRLPGEHHLSMVIWGGGKPVAMIDGKLLKEGALLDRKTLTKIESDGVWFVEEGIKYYLGLEK